MSELMSHLPSTADACIKLLLGWLVIIPQTFVTDIHADTAFNGFFIYIQMLTDL